MKASIYQILNNVNGKFYIGSTTNFSRRRTNHLWHLKKGTHSSRKLQNSYNKYGEDKFIFLNLEIFDYLTKEDILKKEQEYINNLKPYYNISLTAGSCLGVKRTKEFNKKVSVRMRIIREKIIALLNSGKSTKDIVEELKIARSTVAAAKRELRILNGTEKGSLTKRKEIIDTSNNHIYSSIKEAAKANNINFSTLYRYLTGETINKTTLKFYD